ncbi:regulatory protein RecX [Luteimonas sp. MJ250]|uniref:regulatory protein RecX n=1 Tax=Luteimonas sp. MJ250 TaxID=3129236 RepID=UPI0031BA14FA
MAGADEGGADGGACERTAGARAAGERATERGRRRRPELTPAQRALALLVRREHSRKELVRKLEARGIEGPEAEAAVERMAEAGWQDDGRFAAGLARMRAEAGYGPLRIRAELGTHGLGNEAIEAAFEALAESGADDWRASARRLVRRRHGTAVADDAVLRRKAADLLFRRGFDHETVRAATAFGDADD